MFLFVVVAAPSQWCNRQGGGRGEAECPQRLLTGKFLLTYWEKKRQGKKGKGVKTIEKKRRKIVKGKVENWKWKVENLQNQEGGYFFLLSLFKTTKICFRCTKMDIFYRGKAFHAGKNDFASSEKFSCYAPAPSIWMGSLISHFDTY